MRQRKIRIGRKYILALQLKLQSKNLIVLKGSRGYVMCGYLDMSVAERFQDVAVKITGVSTIQEAVRSHVHSCTSSAERLGIREGQSVRDILKIIA